MKEDNLYLENLTEYVYDEKKFVNYKFLSIKLGVHVNLAKQMLYKFYEMEKAGGKKIYAMYYLSGLAPQNWISNLGNGDNEEDGSQESFERSKDDDSYLVMLCKDHELEKFKKRFSRLYSVHVYGLSSFPVNNLDVLNKAAERFLRDDDGNAPVHYGPITCKAGFEYHEDPRLAPLLQNIKEVQQNLVKTKEKQKTVEVENKTREAPKALVIKETANAKRGAVATAGKKSNDSSSTTVSKDRLKNMFAAAASKPRTKEPEKPQTKKSETNSVKVDESVSNSRSKQFGKWKEVEDSTKSNRKKVSTRKRKRIRDVFSSSDEDEDDKKSVQSDSEGLPESPIPWKRNQIESDSEEEIQAVEETPKDTVSPLKSGTVLGRRRVWKRVPKRHVDEHGFLVTEIERVLVSESDHSDQEENETTNRSDKKATTETKVSKMANVEVSHPPVSATKVPAAGKDKKSSSNAVSVNAKTKQVSIMSFFQKK